MINNYCSTRVLFKGLDCYNIFWILKITKKIIWYPILTDKWCVTILPLCFPFAVGFLFWSFFLLIGLLVFSFSIFVKFVVFSIFFPFALLCEVHILFSPSWIAFAFLFFWSWVALSSVDSVLFLRVVFSLCFWSRSALASVDSVLFLRAVFSLCF